MATAAWRCGDRGQDGEPDDTEAAMQGQGTRRALAITARGRTGALVRRALAWVTLAVGALAAGCGSDAAGSGDAPAAAATAALKAKGGFAVTIDGTPFSIDYATGVATVDIVHKLNADPKGYGCVTSVRMTLAKADGSCQLQLRFQPTGGALRLVEGQFAAALGVRQGGVVIDTKVCAGFPGADAGGEVLWTWKGGNADLAFGAIGPPEASKETATIADASFAPKGKIDLAHKGKLFVVDLGGLSITGKATSTGSASVSCGAATGVDVCPEGVTYGASVGEYIRRPGAAYSCIDETPYDLGELCGQPQVVIVYDHWLANPQRNPNAGTFGGKDVLDGLKGLVDKYGKDVAFALVIRTGAKKVVVEDPAKPGSYMIGGPAPTAQDCADVRTAYNVPSEVVVLFDKDRALNSLEKRLTDASIVPSLLTADASGKILEILPVGEKKMELATVEAAIEAAMAAQ